MEAHKIRGYVAIHFVFSCGTGGRGGTQAVGSVPLNLLLSQGKMPDDLSNSIAEKWCFYKATFLTIP